MEHCEQRQYATKRIVLLATEYREAKLAKTERTTDLSLCVCVGNAPGELQHLADTELLGVRRVLLCGGVDR